jgi:hypothetical protein
MRAMILALAAPCVIALAAPVMAQGEELDVDTAMECGVYNSFLGGVIEAEDPQSAAELEVIGATWMAMGLIRLGGDEDVFDSILETKTDRVALEVEQAATVEAAKEDLLVSVVACEIIREDYADEFFATMESLAG